MTIDFPGGIRFSLDTKVSGIIDIVGRAELDRRPDNR